MCSDRNRIVFFKKLSQVLNGMKITVLNSSKTLDNTQIISLTSTLGQLHDITGQSLSVINKLNVFSGVKFRSHFLSQQGTFSLTTWSISQNFHSSTSFAFFHCLHASIKNNDRTQVAQLVKFLIHAHKGMTICRRIALGKKKCGAKYRQGKNRPTAMWA